MNNKAQMYDMFMNMYMMRGFNHVAELARAAFDRDDHGTVRACGEAYDELLREVAEFIRPGEC